MANRSILLKNYCISLNNSCSDYSFFTKKGVIVQGRRLFQILLITGSHALNILFCYHIKSKKIITSNKQQFGSLVNFNCQYAHCQSLNRHWLVSFAASDSASTLFTSQFLTWQGGDQRKRGWQEGLGEALLFKGGNYF